MNPKFHKIVTPLVPSMLVKHGFGQLAQLHYLLTANTLLTPTIKLLTNLDLIQLQLTSYDRQRTVHIVHLKVTISIPLVILSDHILPKHLENMQELVQKFV